MPSKWGLAKNKNYFPKGVWCFLDPLPDLSIKFLTNITELPLFSSDSIWIDLSLLLALIVSLIFSGFFSAIETALTSSNNIRLRNLMDENKRGARKAVYLSENYDKTITAILIGNNLVNIGASTIAASMFARIFILGPTWSSVVSTVVMTILVLIFGEILPKTFAKENPEKTLLSRSMVMWVIMKFFTPLTWLFMQIKRAANVIKHDEEVEVTPSITDKELETIIDVMEGEGVIDEDRADLIQSALDLENKVVGDIMTPRVDIDAIEISTPPHDIYVSLHASRYSRVPIYEGDKDNIIGILSVKDFMFAIIEARDNREQINVRNLLTEPYFISKNTKADDLLTVMQSTKRHMAIVVDEYGGTAGIVTMEDVLEELVGEIYDEYDEIEEDDIIELSENHYQVSPDMEVDELFDELHLGEAPANHSPLVGGFVYELASSLPEVDMEVTLNHRDETHEVEKSFATNYLLTFIIKEVENRRIVKLELIVEKLNEEEI